MGTIKKLKSKLPAKGSVLVFTLIVLFIILASAIGISSVSVLERKGAGSTGVSVQSFQTANSGAEIILKKIADNNSGTLNDLGTCAGGKLTGLISSGKNYEITFYKNDGLPIADCTTVVSEVDKIKSIGSYANTTRAIEVAVAAGESGPRSWDCQLRAGSFTNPSDVQYTFCDTGYVLISGGCLKSGANPTGHPTVDNYNTPTKSGWWCNDSNAIAQAWCCK